MNQTHISSKAFSFQQPSSIKIKIWRSPVDLLAAIELQMLSG
ncbi:hypothetical protein LINPERPRIM_LOCUS33343 [Linum perenne]